MLRQSSAALLATVGLLLSAEAVAAPPNRITVLYDAFGDHSALKKDWGFSTLVEFGGKRILFDTGNDADLFEHNVKSLGVDLKAIDLVVISHRHGDHTSGLARVLKANPGVPVYVPADETFMTSTPVQMYHRGAEALPKRMRYFDGETPVNVPHGTAWKGANLIPVDASREILPGISVVATTSKVPRTIEMPELSLSLKVPEGQILVVGCSHTGIEAILEKAAGRPIQILVGGLHLVTTPDPEIERLATSLRDKWKVASVAVGHCTSEPGFAALQRAYGERYIYAGLGTVVPLP
ncbi:MBL fold metallo-hydrolase [Paludisphaera mucosa]|uniref:MBL fold metallo-hydrolase n=1 Tax=Paludisphaera mucosa TaxID=3030827 RepID=A0ABT6F9Y2_9BACT|nr:MBL fold metallo-hydrolase [Paludisphaera mucosa]MDG3004396.1 MBL fold metallo-hydrolase [Paludisphaera mucosa]